MLQFANQLAEATYKVVSKDPITGDLTYERDASGGGNPVCKLGNASTCASTGCGSGMRTEQGAVPRFWIASRLVLVDRVLLACEAGGARPLGAVVGDDKAIVIIAPQRLARRHQATELWC